MITWHRHHIVPRHAGGSDDPSNLLKCNIAMHAFMHEQRYREIGDEYDRIAAATLRGQIPHAEASKLALIESNKKRKGVKRPRQSELMSGENNPMYGVKRPGNAMMNAKLRNKITVVDGIEYPSRKAAMDALGLNKPQLRKRMEE